MAIDPVGRDAPALRPEPADRAPSTRFTWGVRGALLLVLALPVSSLVSDGVPVDAWVRWRWVIVLVALVVEGAAAILVWTSAARPRRPFFPPTSPGVTRLPDADRRAVHAALRRGTPLPAALRPWARDTVVAQQNVVTAFAFMVATGANTLVSPATTVGRPDWISVGLAAVSAMMVLPVCVVLERQRARVERLDRSPTTDPRPGPPTPPGER